MFYRHLFAHTRQARILRKDLGQRGFCTITEFAPISRRLNTAVFQISITTMRYCELQISDYYDKVVHEDPMGDKAAEIAKPFVEAAGHATGTLQD